jgi:orotidine-5'-phosphate decarboxylase
VSKAPIVLAVDTPELKTAIEWVKATEGLISVYKLGLEFFLSFGISGVRAIQEQTDADIFLDLKLHDIPHTVSGATKAIANLAPKYLTVHASGGAVMVRAAADAIPDSYITGVTILTSLGDEDVKAIGYLEPALESAVRLAKLAVASGARAIVCSPLEITAIRKAVGLQTIIITPGVRPAGSNKVDDQVRTMTPAQAMSAGANFLVVGRPITSRWSEGKAAMAARASQLVASIYG